MIDRSRIPPNMGVHEYLMRLDEPRQRPGPSDRVYPLDHSRRDWIEFERHWLAKIEQVPQADELIRCLLVTAKRDESKKAELEGVWRVLLQSVAAQRDGESSTAGTGRQATSHP
jgi:hypothetical protein